MTPPRATYEVKAAALRGYVVQIEKLGVLAAVMAKVSLEVRAAIEAPPLPSVWDRRHADRGNDRGAAGAAGARCRAHRDAQRPEQRRRANLDADRQRALRLFGATPDTLLSRFPDLTRTVIRGVDFRWALETNKSGALTVAFRRKNMPRHVFIGMESGCWMTLELCRVKGNVADTQISNDGSTGVIRVSW